MRPPALHTATPRIGSPAEGLPAPALLRGHVVFDIRLSSHNPQTGTGEIRQDNIRFSREPDHSEGILKDGPTPGWHRAIFSSIIPIFWGVRSLPPLSRAVQPVRQMQTLPAGRSADINDVIPGPGRGNLSHQRGARILNLDQSLPESPASSRFTPDRASMYSIPGRGCLRRPRRKPKFHLRMPGSYTGPREAAPSERSADRLRPLSPYSASQIIDPLGNGIPQGGNQRPGRLSPGKWSGAPRLQIPSLQSGALRQLHRLIAHSASGTRSI